MKWIICESKNRFRLYVYAVLGLALYAIVVFGGTAFMTSGPSFAAPMVESKSDSAWVVLERSVRSYGDLNTTTITSAVEVSDGALIQVTIFVGPVDSVKTSTVTFVPRATIANLKQSFKRRHAGDSRE